MSGLASSSFRRPTSPPVVRRTHDCSSESTDYTPAGERPQRATCRDCGRLWVMQYAPNGEAIGYTMRAPMSGLLASAHS